MEVKTMPSTRTQRFTTAEVETAKDTDLPDLLAHLGYQVRRVGRYYTTKEMDSLRIKDRRTWYRYSEQVGGDAISFLQHFCGKSFPEAVNYLLDYHGQARPPPVPAVKSVPAKERVPFALPSPNADQRRVFAYLRKRGIAAQVIQGFIQAELLYEDAEHHNCVFVGRNTQGQPVFANQRGTYDLNGAGFKGDVPGSDKTVAFRLFSNPQESEVYVFEAPIDLMSYCTLHREVTHNAVALCGLYDGPLESYLKENPNLRHIILCLDADQWGKQAAEQIKSKYEAKGYAVFIQHPPRGKDWNEYLQQRVQSRERGR